MKLSSRVDVKVLLSLSLVLLVGLALRLWLLAGPQTELEADEAVVGLMGRHILQGERPVFYYMQPYLGSLEAYLVAGSFAVLGSSTFALKLVPLLCTLLFIGLVFATGYRIGGLAAAVVPSLYLAVPPAFFALWSLKARGGYIETLVLGQTLLLMAMKVRKTGRVGPGMSAAMGFLGGLGLWLNPLIGVYLVPVALHLLLALRHRLFGLGLLAALAGAIVGAFPLIQYNLTHGLATADAMFGGKAEMAEAPDYLYRFFRYSLPILAGLAQASSSTKFFWSAFSESPAASGLVARATAGAFLLLFLFQSRRLLALVRGKPEGADGRALLALLLVAAPTAFVLTRFRELVTEPRYLLPLYSAAPLLSTILVAGGPVRRRLLPLIVVALLALNVYSLASLDPRLNLPDTALGSVASNRRQLADFLLSQGLDRIYTDYWIAYPLAFETGERVVPSVISNGFNRYYPYSNLVSTARDPAFVFVAGSKEENDFLARLAERQVEARRDEVSIYSVYSRVTPLDRIRP